jgi:Kelch motif/Galactose oxidase, central domain
MHKGSRHRGLRVQELGTVFNLAGEIVGGLVVLVVVAGALIGLVQPFTAVLVVIAGMAVVAIVTARQTRTGSVRSPEGAWGVMAILVVTLVVVMMFPYAGIEKPLASLNPAPSATLVASAAPSAAQPESPLPVESASPTPGRAQFAATGSMKSARDGHTATLLPGGSVLVAGGHATGESGSFVSAELYDPATGTFSPTGSMAQPRMGHTATTVQRDGGVRVLIVGGFDDNSQKTTVSAELYDPTSGTFAATGSLSQARFGQTATLLADGRVLIAGGQSRALALNSAEVYDPKTGTFTLAGPMTQSRFGQTATLLPNGQVLVAGGYNASQMWLASAELYDPATGKFSPAGNMGSPRVFHAAVALADGRVLITGGSGKPGFGGSLASVEIYDSSTGKFSPAGSMTNPRSWHSASLLSGGRVLVAGGQDDKNSGFLSSADFFDPVTNKFTATGSMKVARANQTATLLPDGRTLIVGGDDGSGNLSSAELFG